MNSNQDKNGKAENVADTSELFECLDLSNIANFVRSKMPRMPFYLITVKVLSDKNNVFLLVACTHFQHSPAVLVLVFSLKGECEKGWCTIIQKKENCVKRRLLKKTKGIEKGDKNVICPLSSSTHSGPRLCPR